MEKRTSRVTVSLLITLALLLSLFSTTAASFPKRTYDLQLLAINDFHGALNPGTTRGGAEYLATLVKQKEAENKNTLFVSAGDLIGASPLVSALFHDEPTIKALNMMGLDYSAIGNHEFDEGLNELLRMQRGGCHPEDGCLAGKFKGAKFDYLAANVIRTKNGRLVFPAYKIRSFGGAPVAFVGISLDYTPTIVTPAGVAGLEFENEEEVINSTVKFLKRFGVRTIIMLIHDGSVQTGDWNSCTDMSPDIVDVVNNTDKEVDVFITGHTHNAYICDISGRLVTSAGSSGNFLTEIDLKIDRLTGKIVNKSAQNIPVDIATLTKDPEMEAMLNEYRALAAPLQNRIIGSITADIKREATRDVESALGDVIADAQLWATSSPETGGAVVALMNPGGIRADFIYDQISGSEQPGEVTYGEAFTVQPFYNDLVTMTLTGDQIRRTLEQQYDTARLLQVSNGFTYTFNKSAPAGERITDLMIGGVPVDMAASYRVTVNSFLATGGDGFTVLNEGTDRLVGQVDVDALVDYFEANSPIAPGPKDRITILP